MDEKCNYPLNKSKYFSIIIPSIDEIIVIQRFQTYKKKIPLFLNLCIGKAHMSLDTLFWVPTFICGL
jgi:hypothetical protein